MPAYVNIPDFIKIGVMAMIFVWGANKALRAAGLDQFTA